MRPSMNYQIILCSQILHPASVDSRQCEQQETATCGGLFSGGGPPSPPLTVCEGRGRGLHPT